MSRHVFTREECQRGGKARAALPDFQDHQRRNFWRTMDTHPFYARKWLKKKIQAYNLDKDAQLIAGRGKEITNADRLAALRAKAPF